MNKLDTIEDWLCDLVDSTYNDGIICDKEFVPSVDNCRALTINTVTKGNDDQSIIEIYDATFRAVRAKRSQAVIDFNIFNEILPFYNKKISDKLVISANLTYSIVPSKMMVDNKTVYIFSVNFKITII